MNRLLSKALRIGAPASVLVIGALVGCERRVDPAPAARPPPPVAAASVAAVSIQSSEPRAAGGVKLLNAELAVPEGTRPAQRVPFLLVLHGLGDSGRNFAERLEIAELSRKRRFAYAAPDGSFDRYGRRFWNAWTACCDFDQLGPDHVRALNELLEQAAAHPAIDAKRRYVLGFSNGGFMAHRLACQLPGVAAIASIAGAGPSSGENCRAPTPVAVLQVHGDLDRVIAYDGGHALNDPKLPVHASASETASAWARRNGCGSPLQNQAAFDLQPDLPGKETRALRYSGCKRPVELWTVRGGEHVLAVDRAALERILDFLERAQAE